MNSAKFCGLLCLTLLATITWGAPAPRPKSLPALHSRAEFDALARVTDTPYLLPHLLFVIDRRDHDRIYYADSKRYKFHRDFVNAAYLSLETGQKFFADNYLSPNRRFVMGTLAYQTPVKRWTFEFWEGDTLSAPLLKLAAARIGATFFAPVAFKPNSLQQEETATSVPNLARLLPDAIVTPSDYQPLNKARAIGRLHSVTRWDENADIRPGDILIINEAPVDLPPVAGLITTQPASPLSHINLRARSWGIPNAYIARAAQALARYEGQTVVFETRSDQYLIGHPSAQELAQWETRAARRHALMTPRLDLSVTAIAGLSQQRASSVTAYGAKSANLGEVQHAHLPGVQVPDGFTLPFFRYAQFVRQNGLEAQIAALLHDSTFAQDAAVRRRRLADLRAQFQKGAIPEDLKADVLKRAHAQFPGQGLFVRSSTNSEDLPNFNGAGLYTTVPNAQTDEQILDAIKTVWASVWNAEAYEARERAGIDHQKVAMAVLLQRGVNADSAGVLITADPFDPQNTDAIYVSAKRGLGIKVVEGKKIPEQVIFHPDTNAVQVLTRSAEDSLLTFDAHGGVREVAFTDKHAVLTDDVVHRLAHAAAQIRRLFGAKPQDIEWAVQGGQVYIVQARPYLSGNRNEGGAGPPQANIMKLTLSVITLLVLALSATAAPAKPAAPPLPTPTVWPNSVSRANSDPWLAVHHDQITQMRPRLLVLNFANGVSTEQATGQVQKLMAALAESSRFHGYADAQAPPFLQYELFKVVDLTDPDPHAAPPSPDGNSSRYPRDADGPQGSGRPNFHYADLFSPKFAAYYGVSDPKRPGRFLTLGELVDSGLVHEVWFLAIQGSAGAPSETTELKQVYDAQFHKVPGKWVQAGNALPGSEWPWTGRSLRILFLNASRGPGCAMESLSHSLEATANANAIPYFARNFIDYAGFDLDKRFGLPFDRLYGHSPYAYPDPTTLVYKQDGKDVAVPNYIVTGGNVHFCPSARQDYDLDSPFTVMSTIEHYGLRDGEGGKDKAEPWTVARFKQFNTIAPDCQGPWLVYWRQNMPGHAGKAVGLDGRPAKNWWPFLFY